MNKPLSISMALAALIFSVVLTGCANTLNGAKEDADKNTQAARDTATQAGQAIKAVPENIDANTVIRPAVKTAIIRDPVLNDKRNLIDVNAQGHTVTLTGHVADASMKPRAEEDAQAVLKSRHADFTVVDQLTVAPSNQ